MYFGSPFLFPVPPEIQLLLRGFLNRFAISWTCPAFTHCNCFHCAINAMCHSPVPVRHFYRLLWSRYCWYFRTINVEPSLHGPVFRPLFVLKVILFKLKFSSHWLHFLSSFTAFMPCWMFDHLSADVSLAYIFFL